MMKSKKSRLRIEIETKNNKTEKNARKKIAKRLKYVLRVTHS